MLTIWKYPVRAAEFAVQLPADGQVLTVQMQAGAPCIWVLLDPRKPTTTRTFRCFGTGHDIPSANLRYIGTWQERDGKLVFHLFEVPQR